MTRLIGIDVGGTKCLGVLLDADGHVHDEVVVPTPSAASLVETLRDIVEDLGGAERVGVGLPGLIDRGGVIRSSPNLPDAQDLPIGEPLRRLLGSQVAVDNDATCALIAENRLGVARGLSDAWLVTLGTGIGGALLADGVVRRGSQGFAGEVGHMRVDPRGDVCPCGLRGCWERYASGSALARLAGEDGAEEVIRSLRGGDARHREALDLWVGWIATGLAALVNATDPQMVVIGGGVIEEGDLFVADVERLLHGALYAPSKRRLPDVRPTSFGRRAGAIGAALLTQD